jgi:hypothetical protein
VLAPPGTQLNAAGIIKFYRDFEDATRRIRAVNFVACRHRTVAGAPSADNAVHVAATRLDRLSVIAQAA